MNDSTFNAPLESHDRPTNGAKSARLLPTVVTIVIGITASSIVAVRTMQQSLDKVYAATRSDTSELNGSAGETSEAPEAGPQITRGNPVHGKQLFNMSCFVCHGPTGMGVPGLGPTLKESKFVASRSDEQLAAFVKVGRQPGDPNTVLNLTMPPKGGNPMLDDNGLRDVVSFIRTLQAR